LFRTRLRSHKGKKKKDWWQCTRRRPAGRSMIYKKRKKTNGWAETKGEAPQGKEKKESGHQVAEDVRFAGVV